jgi:hypothetical protein
MNNSAYEIVESRADKQLRELKFWAELIHKELDKLNKIFDEVFAKCQADLDKEKENETKL